MGLMSKLFRKIGNQFHLIERLWYNELTFEDAVYSNQPNREEEESK
jgi:hypothetical protein